jgi:ABC-type Fe3+ transport system substrate-binding protein
MQAVEIAPEMTIFEITERYPQTIQVFVDNGFPKMGDPEKRRAQGKALTIRAAASIRKLDLAQLVQRLTAAVETEAERVDLTLSETNEMTLLPPGDLRVSGLLPCPVRIPILEALGELARTMKQEQQVSLGWSLSAASVGADGLNHEIARIKDQADLPEVFVSAGFESFFDRKNLHRFKDQGVFVDVAPPGQNDAFGDLALRDPEGHFTILGVVPAVFLVNQNQLGNDPAPRTWEALLHPRFQRRVALPVGDFDLFNGILLNLYRTMGESAIRDLARNMLVSLHPSQTVGRFSGRAPQQPAVSIIPYFFSKMTMKSQTLRVVWPEDGAIISPIFMLVRRDAQSLAEPLTRLLLSREVGEILAHRGLFPVLSPEVDNRLPPGSRFQWLGWDFIQGHDLGQLIPHLDQVFRGAGEGAG